MTTSTNNTSNLMLPGAVAVPFVTAEDLDGHLGKILMLEDDGEVALSVAGVTDKPVGILVGLDATGAGATCLVCVSGPCKVVAGGAIDEGVDAASDANGEAVAGATNDWLIGPVLRGATAANDLVIVNVSISNEIL